jgi:hypothetical protein
MQAKSSNVFFGQGEIEHREHIQTSFFLAMGGGQCHTLTNVLSPCYKKAEMGRLSHAAGSRK